MRFFLSIFLFTTGCGGLVSVDPSYGGPGSVESGPKDTLSFSTVQDVVFRSASGHCLNCHSDQGGSKGGYNFETYDGVARALNEIQAQIAGGGMPEDGGPLGDYEKSVLAAWVALGAPEVSEQPLPPKP